MRNREAERIVSLCLMMLRFATNSYETVCFINTKDDASHLRKQRFVLTVAPINRQILDLLFTIVYMRDDFPARSMDYELSGYRGLREESVKFEGRFGGNPEWQPWLLAVRAQCSLLETYLNIPAEMRAKPDLIPRWPTPSRLRKKQTACKDFLNFLHDWLYDDTSAQAHLTAGGLMMVGMMVVSDLLPDRQRELADNYIILRYQFAHVSRTFAIVLAIASELNCFYDLGHDEAIHNIWGRLGGYSEEARDLYERRYRGLVPHG
jgi:hypothetical protein